MKLISLLMPVYNKSEYLEQTLKSINKQLTRGEFEFEVIIVDDLSQDNSLELIKNFQWKHKYLKRVEVIANTENVGPAVSFNKALAIAEGDYIAPLDADDLLTRLSLLSRVRYLDLHPEYDFVGAGEVIMNYEGGFRAGVEFSNTVIPTEHQELFDMFVADQLVIPAQSVMFRSQILKKYGWNSKLRSSQDFALTLVLLANGHRIGMIDDYVAIYRSHSHDRSKSLFGQSIISGQKITDFENIIESVAGLLTPAQEGLLQERLEKFRNHSLRQQ